MSYHILRVEGRYPKYRATIEVENGDGWVGRVLRWFSDEDIETSEVDYISESSVIWYRESDGRPASYFLNDALYNAVKVAKIKASL